MSKSDVSNADLEVLRDWFRTWDRCVAALDFASARALFADDVVGFGTHATFVHGLDALEAEQWRKVWPNIADFRFEVEHLVGGVSHDSAWAAVPWSSRGFHEDGTEFDRPGRATVTFRKSGDDWLGTHTHFSLAPATPPHTFGRK
ncbi:MAG: YybH family protein [Hyphomicrobiaceae bacterium]